MMYMKEVRDCSDEGCSRTLIILNRCTDSAYKEISMTTAYTGQSGSKGFSSEEKSRTTSQSESSMTDIKKDAQSIREDLHDLKEDAGKLTSHAAEGVKQSVKDGAQSVSDFAHSTTDKVAKYNTAACESIRERPVSSVLIALGVGVVLGKLMGR
jgi:ElaB/YqjD/DUF883 family membrane-anchored ribosome-binding protein